MSGEKTTTKSSQQATATPEERALMQQQLNMNAFMQPYAQTNYADLSKNIQAILEGQQPMAKGIGGIGDDQITEIVKQSLRDLPTSLQASGVLDSGSAQEYYGRQAANVRSQMAQFNTSAAQNLFNLAAGGQSNLAGQFQSNTNNLTSQLAGLRNISGSTSTIGMNPFLKSFQTSLGQSIGSGSYGNMAFGGSGKGFIQPIPVG